MSNRPYSLPVMITAFILLYLIQGLLFGYIASIQVIIKTLNFSYFQISLLKWSTVPFYIKCFFSPFLDKIYSQKVGKRMTYILIFSLLTVASYLYIAAKVDGWLDDKQMVSLAASLTLAKFLIAIQDLAIDALAEEIFTREDVKFGAITQSIGQIIGPLMSYNLFMYLKDQIPGLTVSFLHAMVLFVVLTTVFVYFYIRESPSKSEFDSVLDIFLVFPNFLKNKYVRTWFAYILTSNAPIVFFDSVLQLVYIEKGLPTQTLSHIALPGLISALFFSFLMGRFKLSTESTMRYLRVFHIITFFISLANVIVLLRFNPKVNLQSTIIWLYIIGVLEGSKFGSFVIRSNYINLVCDNSISCTFISIMASLSNFARLFLAPLYTSSLDRFSFRSMALFALTYQIMYILIIYPKCIAFFTPLGKKHFKIVTGKNESSEKKNDGGKLKDN